MLIAGCALLSHPATAFSSEVLLPSGSYLPFFSPQSLKDKRSSDETIKKPVTVKSFWMEIYPVTNGDFLKFVRNNSDWRRSKVSRIFADDSYLKHWKGDLALKSPKDLHRPVTHVSWFAAQAYCESLGREPQQRINGNTLLTMADKTKMKSSKLSLPGIVSPIQSLCQRSKQLPEINMAFMH